MSFDFGYKGSVEKRAVGDQNRSMYKTSSILKMTTQVSKLDSQISFQD